MNEEVDHWFEPVADHLGAAYLRYSFTKGTQQEVEFLIAEMGLVPGMRVLDIGCGPGRHARALAERGISTAARAAHLETITDKSVEPYPGAEMVIPRRSRITRAALSLRA